MPRESFDCLCAMCDRPAVVVLQRLPDAPAHFCAGHEPSWPEADVLRVTAEQLPLGSGRLRFPAGEVRRLLESGRPISWAKDTGTYLCTWADGRMGDMVSAWAPDGLCLDDSVSAADNPALFERIWESTREICGGDDFLESGLDIPPPPLAASWLVLDVTPDSYALSWE